MVFGIPAAPAAAPDCAVTAVGKVPSQAEFLTARTAREPRASFEEWLEAGMEVAARRYGPFWEGAFVRGSVHGFTWRAPLGSRASGLLTGVLLPSRDAIGRLFPFAPLAETTPSLLGAASHVLPLAFGDFLDRTYDAVVDHAVLGAREIFARLAMVAPPTREDVGRAVADYDAWCGGTGAEEGWSAIGGPSGLARALRVVETIRAAHARVGAFGAAPLQLRLPLGGGGSGSAALWLDVVRRVCGPGAIARSAFWAGDGALVVAFGDATPEVLCDLWLPDGANETILDPETWDSAEHGELAYAALGRDVGSGTMRDFLDRLGPA